MTTETSDETTNDDEADDSVTQATDDDEDMAAAAADRVDEPTADEATAEAADGSGDDGEATADQDSDERREGDASDDAGRDRAGRTGTRRRLSPDELAALEEQRDFLLKSLADLDREHAAGDVDEDDYVSLRDDYTTRSARVIRTIEAHTVRVRAERSGPDWRRRIAVVAGVLVFAALAGFLVQQSAGRREAGDTITGGVGQSTRERLDEALRLGSEGRYDDAIALQDEVLDEEPDNPEALTYKGWFLVLSGEMRDGLASLNEAVGAAPEFPDAHAFMAVIFERAGQDDAARSALQRLDQLNPPPEVMALTQPLRERLEASTTTTQP